MVQIQVEFEHVKCIFGWYVFEDVVEVFMVDSGKFWFGGEECEVMILFVDIRGYSILVEFLESTEIIDLFNWYFIWVI